jgi:hypothetical protein
VIHVPPIGNHIRRPLKELGSMVERHHDFPRLAGHPVGGRASPEGGAWLGHLVPHPKRSNRHSLRCSHSHF